MNSGAIRIVLVAPSHPGNIGAAARAMKNMALSDLVLVNPRQFPHPEASAPGTRRAVNDPSRGSIARHGGREFPARVRAGPDQT